MPQINCYIPIKLRLTGRPSDAQLEQLGEALVRALAARIAFAERTIWSRTSDRGLGGDFELVQERYDPSREDVAADGYSVPSHQKQGKLRVVRWRRRRIPRRLKAGILARGRTRLPTQYIRWLLDMQRLDPASWVSRLAADPVSVMPEVDVILELFRVQSPLLANATLERVFGEYLKGRSDVNYFVFFFARLDATYHHLKAALQVNLDELFQSAGLPPPVQMTFRQAQWYVVLMVVNFPLEIEKLIPTEISFEAERVEAAISTAESGGPAESPEHLIGRFTRWGNLDEEGLGAYLLGLTRQSSSLSHYVQRVLDELGRTDRDDVALAFAESASKQDLDRLATHANGIALLERLYDELTSGSISGAEQQQAERILRARARVRPVEVAAEQLTGGGRLVFPFRLPGPTVLDDAPIQAERIGGGHIRVKLPVRVGGTPMFRAETRTLRPEVFTTGLVLDADEWIRVRLYDEGGIIVLQPALYLIELSNRTTTRTWENIGITVATGLSLAAWGVAAGAGTAARVTLGARVVAFLDRAATALFYVSVVVRDHRGWIIETFGQAGRDFVEAVEVAGALAGAYGLGRLVFATPKVIGSLRDAWRYWRSSRAFRELSGDDLLRAENISQKTEQFLNDADQAAAAQGREPVSGGAEASGPQAARPPAGVPTAGEEAPRVILYRGTVYRFVRGRSRQIHDLGDGVYMTLDRELAVRYAQIRRAEVQAIEPGAPGVVLRVEAKPEELGRVLDFYNNQALRTEWEAFVRSQPGGEIVLRGGPAEVYNGHFENWLRTKGLNPEQFDVIIGPEYIRGGSQVCIRNESLAESLLARAEEWARAHEPVTPAYPEVPAPRLP